MWSALRLVVYNMGCVKGCAGDISACHAKKPFFMDIRKPLEMNEILKITNFEITEFACNYIKNNNENH